jgi:hypothetical protein
VTPTATWPVFTPPAEQNSLPCSCRNTPHCPFTSTIPARWVAAGSWDGLNHASVVRVVTSSAVVAATSQTLVDPNTIALPTLPGANITSTAVGFTSFPDPSAVVSSNG